MVDIPNPQPEPAPSKKRKKMTEDDAEMIWEAYERRGDFAAKLVAESLGYKKSTYYNAIHNKGGCAEKWKLPERSKKWDEQEIKRAIKIIEENPVLTLAEIVDTAVLRGNSRISPSTLSRYLDDKLITMKKANYHPIARNADDTKQERITYSNWFLQNQHKSLIFIDEFGFSIGTQRNRGRAKVGDQVIIKTPSTVSENLSVFLVIEKSIGIVFCDCQVGSLNRESFKTYFERLCRTVNRAEIRDVVFIFDNCGIHSDNDMNEICPRYAYEYKFLPKYSPMLNPIEGAIKDVKHNIRSLLATTLRAQLLATYTLPWGEKTRGRQEVLKTALFDSTNVPVRNFQAHFDKMMSFFPAIFANNDI